jgi:hypothetical protein
MAKHNARPRSAFLTSQNRLRAPELRTHEGQNKLDTAVRHGDPATHQHGDTAARRLGGAAARRHGGTAARRHGGTAARRHGGTATRRYGGTAGDTAAAHQLTYAAAFLA